MPSFTDSVLHLASQRFEALEWRPGLAIGHPHRERTSTSGPAAQCQPFANVCRRDRTHGRQECRAPPAGTHASPHCVVRLGRDTL
jgi:hypothetical protein